MRFFSFFWIMNSNNILCSKRVSLTLMECLLLVSVMLKVLPVRRCSSHCTLQVHQQKHCFISKYTKMRKSPYKEDIKAF